MTTDPPSLLTDDDLAAELAAARRAVTRLLEAVRGFSTLSHAQPWLHLDDLLSDLRAAAITVATLEQLQGIRR